MLQESIQVPLLRSRITQNALQLSFFFLFLIPSAAFERASKIFEYDPSVISVDIGNQD